MPIDFETTLRNYADLTVAVGLNLQPDQRLLIIGPVANGGGSLEAPPPLRGGTAAAPRPGARLLRKPWGGGGGPPPRPPWGPPRFFGEVFALASGAPVPHR